MRKHLVRNVAVLGGLLAVVSIGFEFVRMNPTYRFIVEPWSIRGYDLTQGKVVAAVGVGVIVLSILAASPQGSTIFNAIVGFGVWLAAVLIAQFPNPPEVTLQLASFPGIVVMATLSYVVTKVAINVAGSRIPLGRVRYAKWGTFAAIFAITYFAIARPGFISPNSLGIQLSVIVAVTMAVVVLGATTAKPRQLATARIAIVSVLAGWVVVATVGTSARTTLIQSQIEVMGVSGSYRDTQITSGIMIAFAGMLIAFVASVGIWARKRDRLLILDRARKQQAAAAQSAAELAEAEAQAEAAR